MGEGNFLTVTSGQDRALSDIANQRPNKLLDAVYQDKSGGPFTQYLNPAAFAFPALGTNGDMGRADVVGAGTWQLDVALSRNIRVTGNQGFELRAEAYNLTNSFRPGNPMTALNRPQFGWAADAGAGNSIARHMADPVISRFHNTHLRSGAARPR